MHCFRRTLTPIFLASLLAPTVFTQEQSAHKHEAPAIEPASEVPS